MPNYRWILTLGLSTALLCGCDRSEPSHAQQTQTQSAPAPSTQPADQASAVLASATTAVPAAPATQPDATSITITESVPSEDGTKVMRVSRSFDFPHARLHIDRDARQAVLYSDDPKSAINSNYTGNSYYLEIPLDDVSIDHLDAYQYHLKATSSELQDTAKGIFLQGQRYHLEPMDIDIAFKGDGAKVQVGIGGEFFKFDMTHTPIERSQVTVSGIVDVLVDVAK